jgi:hypothetical protein
MVNVNDPNLSSILLEAIHAEFRREIDHIANEFWLEKSTEFREKVKQAAFNVASKIKEQIRVTPMSDRVEIVIFYPKEEEGG